MTILDAVQLLPHIAAPGSVCPGGNLWTAGKVRATLGQIRAD